MNYTFVFHKRLVNWKADIDRDGVLSSFFRKACELNGQDESRWGIVFGQYLEKFEEFQFSYWIELILIKKIIILREKKLAKALVLKSSRYFADHFPNVRL